MNAESTILNQIKKYFIIQELVDKSTYDKFGDVAWQFLDIRLLETLLFIRIGLGKKIKINDWYFGGKFDERGLRTNICYVVKSKSAKNQLYLTPHLFGKAIDFDVEGMSADEVRNWLISKEKELPYKIRLEYKMNSTGRTINWVHLDVFFNENNDKVELFNV